MILGNPISGTFECRNQAGVLFDPDVVQVSFVKNKAGTIEDTLTYGGVGARDAQLTRTSTGVFAFWYTTDVRGVWTILPRWQQDTDDPAAPIVVTADKATTVLVEASLHQFSDRQPA